MWGTLHKKTSLCETTSASNWKVIYPAKFRKNSVGECIFDYMALHIKCRFNKNSLPRCYFLSIFPAEKVGKPGSGDARWEKGHFPSEVQYTVAMVVSFFWYTEIVLNFHLVDIYILTCLPTSFLNLIHLHHVCYYIEETEETPQFFFYRYCDFLPKPSQSPHHNLFYFNSDICFAHQIFNKWFLHQF